MTDTTAHLLTRDDVRDLRKAHALCFDHNSEATRIRAITRPSEREGERTISIPVTANYVQDFTPGTKPEDYDCFHMEMHAMHDPATATWVRLVKPGMSLGFLWTRGNASPVTNEAGVVVDALDLRVFKDGVPQYVFRIATFVGLDNTARMVRPRR